MRESSEKEDNEGLHNCFSKSSCLKEEENEENAAEISRFISVTSVETP